MENFKELATALAKGINIEGNSVILATANRSEEYDNKLDLNVFTKGDCLLLIEEIIKLIAEPLNEDETNEVVLQIFYMCKRLLKKKVDDNE